MIIIPPTYSKKQQGSLYGLIKFRCIRDPLYSRGDCMYENTDPSEVLSEKSDLSEVKTHNKWAIRDKTHNKWAIRDVTMNHACDDLIIFCAASNRISQPWKALSKCQLKKQSKSNRIIATKHTPLTPLFEMGRFVVRLVDGTVSSCWCLEEY